MSDRRKADIAVRGRINRVGMDVERRCAHGRNNSESKAGRDQRKDSLVCLYIKRGGMLTELVEPALNLRYDRKDGCGRVEINWK